ncbi:MAG: hypothetical protein KAX49_19930, partial [Halanaerobiales bacterium]|nr:hypothetical protein [Halanaerobiales bacterium]
FSFSWMSSLEIEGNDFMLAQNFFLDDLNSKKYKDIVPLYRPIRGFAQDFFCGKNQKFYALEDLNGTKVINRKLGSSRVWVSPMTYFNKGKLHDDVVVMKKEIFDELEKDFALLIERVSIFEDSYKSLNKRSLIDFLDLTKEFSFPVVIISKTPCYSILSKLNMCSFFREISMKNWVNKYIPENHLYIFVEHALGIVHRDGWTEIIDGEKQVNFIMSPFIRNFSMLQGYEIEPGGERFE